ncbi:MAG: sulfate adenylyltransferase [Firmicutes bacterium]|nr:sulfate adenylyltransferase [Bacillota bacterium]
MARADGVPATADHAGSLHPSSLIHVDAVALSDAAQLCSGAFAPLTGFLTRQDYESVVADMRLANGSPWSMPVTLPVDESTARRLRPDQLLGLAGPSGQVAYLMTVQDVYQPDLETEARSVYRTSDRTHPGVARLFTRGSMYVGGPVEPVAFEEPKAPGVGGLSHTPAQARAIFRQRGWRTIVGFQTRNPIHRAHEYIQKCALEVVDGLYMHPLVGPTKGDDIPAEVRLHAYRAVIDHYFPADRVVLGAYDAAMRYAGPREAVFHALVRRNFGCTHFIVGRDHAGVGHFYGPYDAQAIFAEFTPDELGITPMFFENAFYCRSCGNMATTKTCPHADTERVSLSGTKVRAMLQDGISPPAEFSRPEVARILIAAMHQKGGGQLQ